MEIFKRQPVTINAIEMQKLKEIEKHRKDFVNLLVSKKVHIILKEWFEINLPSKKKERINPVM